MKNLYSESNGVAFKLPANGLLQLGPEYLRRKSGAESTRPKPVKSLMSTNVVKEVISEKCKHKKMVDDLLYP